MMTRRRAPLFTATAIGLGCMIALPLAAVAQDVEREAQRAQEAAEEAQQAAQQAQESAREARDAAQQAERQAREETERVERQAQAEARQAREEAQRAEQEAQQEARREAEQARASEDRELARADVERERAAAEPGEIEEIEIVAPRTVRERLPLGRGEQVSMTARVRYEDLDLTQTSDARQLEERVNEAAGEVCEQLATLYPMGDPDPDACARQAAGQAMDQVQSAIEMASR